jgi:hypothetical protein
MRCDLAAGHTLKDEGIEGKELMMIEKQIGRTLAGAPKKSQQTTFGPAEVLVLALVFGFAAFCGAVLLFMTAII